ncbi:MAG: VPLPA-CTERM sorting domain-containing protein [Gammaproteobacteria bacterium]
MLRPASTPAAIRAVIARPFISLIGALLLLGPVAAQASTVLVNTFGPGDSYNSGRGWSVGNVTFPPDFATAFMFSGGVSGGYVDEIVLGVFAGSPGTDGSMRFRATLYSDAPDPVDDILLAPDAMLESIEFTPFFGPQIVTLQASGATLLQPRTTYWLAVEPVLGSTMGWAWNDQGRVGVRSHYDLPPNYGTWTTYPNSTSPAYRITVNAPVVPVPAAAWLFASALGALGWHRRNADSRPQP